MMRLTLHSFTTCFLILWLLPFTTEAQADAPAFATLEFGEFHTYPKNTSSYFIIRRQDDLQKEIDARTGDSTIWKVRWHKDNTYTLKFVSSSDKRVSLNAYYLKHHDVVYNVPTITKDFYIIEGHVDHL